MERLESNLLDSASKKGPIFGLMMYSLSMIVLPLGSFFLTKFLVNRIFGVDANLYAVVVSVIAVHCILVAFVYKAYKEDKAISERKSTEKVD